MQTPHGSTAQKMKFPFKDFFSKYNQIRNYRSAYIYWRNPYWKTSFFVQCMFFKLLKHSMVTLHKKWSFPIRIFSVADLVTFTEEILNGKLHFLCVSNTYKTNLTKLASQLKHACRIIFYEHKFIHTQALMKKLNIFQINMKPPSSFIK